MKGILGIRYCMIFLWGGGGRGKQKRQNFGVFSQLLSNYEQHQGAHLRMKEDMICLANSVCKLESDPCTDFDQGLLPLFCNKLLLWSSNLSTVVVRLCSLHFVEFHPCKDFVKIFQQSIFCYRVLPCMYQCCLG